MFEGSDLSITSDEYQLNFIISNRDDYRLTESLFCSTKIMILKKVNVIIGERTTNSGT
jgi:hypothetical protein